MAWKARKSAARGLGATAAICLGTPAVGRPFCATNACNAGEDAGFMSLGPFAATVGIARLKIGWAACFTFKDSIFGRCCNDEGGGVTGGGTALIAAPVERRIACIAGF